MIAGIQLEAITTLDYYRRFLILEQILNNKHKFITHPHNQTDRNQYILTRYSHLIKELNQLENHIESENHQYYTKQHDINICVQSIQKDYKRCFSNADSSVAQYEKKIMQTWRDGISQNQEKQQIGRKQYECRATNNKNIMFLASQLLKKERQTKCVIQNECKKLVCEINSIRIMMNQKKQLFQENMCKMNEKYFSQKQKLSKFLQSSSQREQISLIKERQSLQIEIKNYRTMLAKSKEQNQTSFSELHTILKELANKFNE